jgi:hypothetical protein
MVSVKIRRPLLLSVLATVFFCLIVGVNMLYVYPNINNAIYGYKMVWFDSLGLVLFFAVGLIAYVPIIVILGKFCLESIGNRSRYALVSYVACSVALIIHQKILLLVK